MTYESSEAPLDHAVPVTADGHTFLPGDRIGVVGGSQETVLETCPGPNSGVITYDHTTASIQFRMGDELIELLNTDHYHWRILASARADKGGAVDHVFQMYVVEFPHTATPGEYSFAFGQGQIGLNDDVNRVGQRDSGRTVARATPVNIDSWTTFTRFNDLVDAMFEFDQDSRLNLAEFEGDRDVTAALNSLACDAEEVVNERFDLQFDDEVDFEVTAVPR